MPAAQRVLILPELLEIIFMFIQLCHPFTKEISDTQPRTGKQTHWGHHRILRCCALVNKVWYREAGPYLWKQIEEDEDDEKFLFIQDCFSTVATPRKQYYAGFIEQGTVDNWWSDPHPLKDLSFDRLTSLRIWLDQHGQRIPRLKAPRLKRLEIAPKDPSFSDPMKHCFEGLVDELAKYIPRIYPHLRIVIFAVIMPTPHLVKRLMKRLPELKVIHYVPPPENNDDQD
ncbi:uncharacterized protein LDX57_000054 [Aspergillus melleus]|uniref:uncharacterized protein n=1 Tax=Aspergillus melleus TaxID=138277 RepID=UPI001E8CD375|nr:uncharacterized protein LDX57_000054 [Aspergillus melleus]KAH8422297.1 hypothetical protein LDX57_000054 [Aspergillus melleus]